MITKERLEQLIKEEATIWHDDYGRIPLNETSEICKCYYMNNEFSHFVICGKYDVYQYELDIDELEEDVETAEWHSEMDCQRIDRLIFPTYGEFSTDIDSQVCFYKNGYKYILHNALPLFENIRINRLTEKENKIIFEQPLTKENYIMACDKCREIFLDLGGAKCQSE